MKFKLGDFVRFVDEKREGYITRIIDAQLVGVTDTDGFEIPVGINNLTYVYGQSGQSNEVVTVMNKHQSRSKPLKNLPDLGIRLVVQSKDKTSSEHIFFIENSTNAQLLYVLFTDNKTESKAEISGIIPPQTLVPVFEENLMRLDKWPQLKIQILYFDTQTNQMKDPLIFNKKFKAGDFHTDKQKLNLSNELAFVFPLEAPKLKIDPIKLKESFFSKDAPTKPIFIPDEEIDLHIEHLRDDHQFLDASEILSIQIAEFEKNLDAAIVNQMPDIIFIHGIGNGTLRHHIHKRLSQHKQVKTFADARKEKFGYGATQVFIK
ncbi:MAG: DNA mismatch repair protein MutS [Pedobacter sp.]|nr:MAG: DNA mismatch repair protein MutS [Pedobacter sp.]